jgi:hypothetical protein
MLLFALQAILNNKPVTKKQLYLSQVVEATTLMSSNKADDASL